MYPDVFPAYIVLGWASLAKSMFSKAIAAFENASSVSRDSIWLRLLGQAHGISGQTEKAEGSRRYWLTMSEQRRRTVLKLTDYGGRANLGISGLTR